MHAMTLSRAALKRAAASMCVLAALVSAGCGGGGGDSAPAPSATTYTLGGSISGLTGSGLVLANAGTTLTVTSGSATFTFGSVLTAGASYGVTVQTSPTGMTCSVANGTGSGVSANVGNVAVTCSNNTYTLGGTVSGLTTAGLVLANGASTVTVATNATTFTLPGTVTFGASYAVTVSTQPTGLTCTVASATGTVPAANITNVAVTCAANTLNVGGTIAGLTQAGLVLRNNGVDPLTVSSGATTFTFATKVAFGAPYAVTVGTQPTGLTCAVTNGAGTMPATNVTNVAVACTINSYTVGGTITGLTTSGLVLANNGVSAPAIAANATSFTFATSVLFNSAYAVTVVTQPAALTCALTNATGTMPAANVINVQVTCAAPVSLGWTWMGGTSSTFSGGVYGTKGTAAASNTPGSRYQGSSVKDSAGNLWLFGGNGGDAAPIFGRLNDLWKFSVTTGQWTWTTGANSTAQTGIYGTQGTPAPANTPGARIGAQMWADSSGNLWLFGGEGLATTSTAGYLNDLWKFSTSTGQWTFVGGFSALNGNGAYGSIGVGSTSNIPGARRSGTTWIDAAGNLWLFGGVGVDATNTQGHLNDLWKFEPSTGKWTWVTGWTAANTLGVYGTQGTAAVGNTPGARQWTHGFTDLAGNLWLFGGYGPSASTFGYYNDVWKFSPTTGLWTWVKGSSGIDAPGVYGTKGVAAAGNTPGGRNASNFWTDAAGTFWVFGGFGRDVAGTLDKMNDLWKYSPSTGLWTWVHGTNVAPAVAGVYGTKGVAAAGNDPGARDTSTSWIDNAGGMWLFGGDGLDGAANNGLLIDMWKY
jgi:N-acetylneuraminic acid mutarotase